MTVARWWFALGAVSFAINAARGVFFHKRERSRMLAAMHAWIGASHALTYALGFAVALAIGPIGFASTICFLPIHIRGWRRQRAYTKELVQAEQTFWGRVDELVVGLNDCDHDDAIAWCAICGALRRDDGSWLDTAAKIEAVRISSEYVKEEARLEILIAGIEDD